MSAADTVFGRQATRHLPELDSLRGLAMLLVVLFHYYGILSGREVIPVAESVGWGAEIIAAGNTGVTLFFLMSGFLLSLPFFEKSKILMGDVIAFYRGRALRIIPLYYLAIIFSYNAVGDSDSALRALFFLHVGFDMFPYSVVWWSLCTEFQFYLLLPWVMVALQYRYGRWCVLLMVGLWGAGHVALFSAPAWNEDFGNTKIQASLFGRGLAFLLGCVCARIYLSRYFQIMKLHQAGCFMGFLFSLFGLWALLSWYGGQGQRQAMAAFPLYHDAEALVWAFFLMFLLLLRNPLVGVFHNRMLAHFGLVSYSMYMVHVPIQFYFFSYYPGFWSLRSWDLVFPMAVSFLLIWVASVGMYYFIERPFLQLKRRRRASVVVHAGSV